MACPSVAGCAAVTKQDEQPHRAQGDFKDQPEQKFRLRIPQCCDQRDRDRIDHAAGIYRQGAVEALDQGAANVSRYILIRVQQPFGKRPPWRAKGHRGACLCNRDCGGAYTSAPVRTRDCDG